MFPSHDPLGLKDFFPCPKPLFANLTTDTLKPQPDYYYYEPQAENVSMQTSRIAALVKVCRVMGGYNPEFPEFNDILGRNGEAMISPIQDFDELAEKGGLTGAIDLFDIRPVAEVLQVLYEARASEKGEIDDLYGITDIMRGATDANETYGAQRMKQNNSDLRIREMQEEMARHARDTIALMAEIIAENFEADTPRS